MKNNNDMKNTEKMKEEIQLRMTSDTWDFSIAHRVIGVRSAKREKGINIWSITSLATAAMAFIIFMTNVYTVTMKERNYSNTGSIYSYAYIKNDNNLDNDIIAARLELTINEAYPMR